MYTPIKFQNECHNPKCFIKLTPGNIKKMAISLYRYLWQRGLEIDTNIYFKQKNHWNRLSKDKPNNTDKKIHEETISKGRTTISYYITEDVAPTTEYTGDFLCITFEGNLYDEINYGDGKIETQLHNFFSHYGLYMEQGYAWSFALYPI